MSCLSSSNGRIVRKLTVPPTEPSIVFASDAFVTSRPAMIDAETSSKLIPPRPVPAPTVCTPLINTLFELEPRI